MKVGCFLLITLIFTAQSAVSAANPTKEQVSHYLRSPQAQNLFEDLKERTIEEIRGINGLSCTSRKCIMTPFILEIGDKTFKADSFEIAVKDGKFDPHRGTAINASLVDPKKGEMYFGDSQLQIGESETDLKLDLTSEKFQYDIANSKNPQSISIPNGVQFSTSINKNRPQDIFHISASIDSEVTYISSDDKGDTIIQSSSPLSVSWSEDRTSDVRRIFVGTNDSKGEVTFIKREGPNQLQLHSNGQAYFLVDGDDALFVTDSLIVDKDQTHGVIGQLQVQVNKEGANGNLGQMKLSNENEAMDINQFDFAFNEQNQEAKLTISNILYSNHGFAFNAGQGSATYRLGNNSKEGKVQLESLHLKNDNDNIRITGVEVEFRDESQSKTGNALLNNASLEVDKYRVDVLIKGETNQDQKLKVEVLADGKNRFYRLFNENGQEIEVNAVKDQESYQAVFKNLDYISSPAFEKFIATDLKLKATQKDLDGSIHSQRVQFIETPVIRSGRIDGLEFNINDKSTNYQGTLEHVLYQKTGSREDAVGKKGKIALIDDRLKGDISFESVFYTKLREGNDLSLIRFDNIDLVAIKDDVLKASAHLRDASFFENDQRTVIEINSIRDISLSDIKNKVYATGDIDKLVQIKTKDKDGKEISYFLIEGGNIDISSPSNSVIGQISARFLEMTSTNGQTIISGDMKAKVDYQGSINASAELSFKGRDLTYSTASHTTGNRSSKLIRIESVSPEGGLDELKIKAGPEFLKDFISFEAKGKAGKRLDFSFVQDKEQGTYFLRAEFKEGDKVKIKMFPFSLESKKEGDSANIELMLTPKGQNYLNHLEIITNIVSAHEITDFLEISNGGMLIAKSPTIGGVGLEIMYQDEDIFNPGIIPFNGTQKAPTYGLGIFHRGESGSETSMGMMLSGDSEYSYQTNGRGVLKIVGMDLPQSGSLPGTMNFYFKRKSAEGNTTFATLFVDTTSYTVDKNVLSRGAAYYEGGRDAGGLGFTVGHSRQLTDLSKITFAAGMNNDFQDPAFCITYEMQLGGSQINRLARDTQDITEFMSPPVNPFGSRSMATITSISFQEAQARHFDRLNYLDWEIHKIESAQKLMELMDKFSLGFDTATIRNIREWDNINFLSKNDEKLIKASLGEATERNYSAHLQSVDNWKRKASQAINLEKLKEYRDEYKRVSERGY